MMICVYFFSHTTITHSFLPETKNIYKESLIKNVYSSTYSTFFLFFFLTPLAFNVNFYLFIYLFIIIIIYKKRIQNKRNFLLKLSIDLKVNFFFLVITLI